MTAVNSPETSRTSVRYLSIDLVERNPDQPRSHFDPDALEELVQSIKHQGILQPILVRPHGELFQILVGERRWRAARAAGLEQIPTILHEVDDQKAQEWALLENLQREDLNAIEEARGYRALMDNYSLTQEEIADRVGKNRASVANSLRLLALPKQYIEDIESSKLSAGHARVLLTLNSERNKRKLRDKIIKRGMSVREAERTAKSIQEAANRRLKAGEEVIDPELKALREQLELHLKTRVSLRISTKNKGKIEIFYNNLDDFDRIIETIGLERE